VITKVVHGWRPGGLLAYLMGPGRAEVHRDPRIVASWDGLGAGWQPERSGPGEFDFRLKPLIAALEAPAILAGLPTTRSCPEEQSGKRGYVWHCSVRVAGQDQVLPDGTWADIARELLHGAGVAERGDCGGPRWFAIRHAEDHIHIAVVLVRQDTGRRFWPRYDYPRLRATARELEQRYGLVVTAPADGTAARTPQRGEREKAARQGREPARVELARAARAAAVEASSPEEFADALRAAGYLVELRWAPSGDPLGYKLARPGDVTAAGEPVFYSGSKLAPDLSLPRLQQRWATLDAGSADDLVKPGDGWSAAGGVVERGRDVVATARRGMASEDPQGVAETAAEVFTALCAAAGRHGRGGFVLVDAADRYDRAARAPRGCSVSVGPVGLGLRRLARRLIAARGPGGADVGGLLALVAALAALTEEISAWHAARGRSHQARAATGAARALRSWRPEQHDHGLGEAAAGRVQAWQPDEPWRSAGQSSGPRGPRPGSLTGAIESGGSR
jgi:hypothetical protein